MAAVAVAATLMLVLVGASSATFPHRLVRAPHVPAAATLYWPSPTLSHPTTIKVTNDNTRLILEPDKDYVIQMPPTPVTSEGGVWLVGGRNIVMVGGEIFNDTPIADGTETDLHTVVPRGPDRHGAPRGPMDSRPWDRAGSRPVREHS